MRTIIRQGHVLNPATGFDAVADILIQDDRIEKIGEQLSEEVDEVIEANGAYVMPGFIDLHVHFRDPGLTYKEDIATGGMAAARGGVTTVCAMPNTKPVVDSVETLQYVKDKAAKESPIRVRQVSAITKDQVGTELVDMEAMHKQGAVAFSEDGKSVMDVQLYAKAMKEAARLGAVVMAHCEDKALVGKGVLNEGVASAKFGVPGITNSVEDVITARDIFLANDYGTKLHLCHCSTKGAVELVRMAKKMGIQVTAEVCPHHFTLTDADIEAEDANFKMNPPLRTEEDVQALIKGLQDGTMEAISTDHAPHSAEEKGKGFMEAPFGIVGLETSASLTYTALVAPGLLTPLQMADKMSYQPAKIIGVDSEYGRIEEGRKADLVIFDPQITYTVDTKEFASKGTNTPYDGKVLQGRVIKTICDGKVVFSL